MRPPFSPFRVYTLASIPWLLGLAVHSLSAHRYAPNDLSTRAFALMVALPLLYAVAWWIDGRIDPRPIFASRARPWDLREAYRFIAQGMLPHALPPMIALFVLSPLDATARKVSLAFGGVLAASLAWAALCRFVTARARRERDASEVCALESSPEVFAVQTHDGRELPVSLLYRPKGTHLTPGSR